MPQPMLHSELGTRVDRFVAKTDLARLYKGYSWGGDSHADGFPDILRLEKQLSRGARQKGVTLQDIRDVAAWGRLRNPGIIGLNLVDVADVALAPTDLYNSDTTAIASSRLLEPLELLQRRVHGLGPTYLSKVLRFADPEHYGAIDTRCVRVFGHGNPLAKKQDWLTLGTHNYGTGWSISKVQPAWPDGYGVWLAILRHIASTIALPCPHPPIFAKEGLRRIGQWACADVEMALFTYASQQVHAVGR